MVKMQNKELLFNDQARSAIKSGIDILADAVKVTLGPNGRCVILGEYKKIGTPHITKDGVTVAKNIKFKDKYKEVGASLIREAALKTVETVGDSTTSSTVIAQALINESEKLIQSGISPVELKRNLQYSLKKAINIIKESSTPIKDSDIKNIATISANNDESIGELIADAYSKITENGVIAVEESNSTKTSVDIVTGMQFEQGFASSYFVTDEIKNECVFSKPYVLISEMKVETMREIMPILEGIHTENRPIVIIAQDFSEEVIETLRINVLNGILRVCCVKAPSYGEYRKMILEDLSILTKANFITHDSALDFNDIQVHDLGTCDKIIISKDKTMIIGGKGQSDIPKRVEVIKARLAEIKKDDAVNQEFLIEFFETRIARLVGGVASIKVGGITELEMKERKDRIDDAVCATKAALEEGIVPGGGITYLKVFNRLYEEKDSKNDLLCHGLTSIFETLCKNSNFNVKDCLNDISPDKNIGINMLTGEVVNMLDAGIVDPTSASRLALENAVSVTMLYLSTACVVVPELVEF
jgi:chaperonin GroEL